MLISHTSWPAIESQEGKYNCEVRALTAELLRFHIFSQIGTPSDRSQYRDHVSYKIEGSQSPPPGHESDGTCARLQ